DAAGRQVPPVFMKAGNKRRIHRFPAKGARKFATLNHYALRSLDSYIVKNDRGDVNRDYRYFDDVYWRERNDAAWEDTSIHRYLPQLTDEMERLKGLPGIRDLHEEAVHLHATRAAELREIETFRDLRDMLRIASPYAPQEAALRELIKKPGVAETIDWAKCLLALDVLTLSPEVIADTLGAILKYQDDIQKLQGSEAKRLLDEAKASLEPA
ncbi:MAG: hypothetical protein AAFU86_10460, partial [Pseudomonadota bacterium]